MSRRLVAVLVGTSAYPTGALRVAMVEDVYETVAGLELVEPVLALVDGDPDTDALAGVTWPGTLVLRLPASQPAAGAALAALAAEGADQVTVVAGDAPDLPGLLVGKLHRALGSAEVAVLPAAGGGLVALATRVPVPPWLPGEVGLDGADALRTLRAVAPRRTAVSVGPGWHRVRSADDLAALDPGLEGWEVTRAVLAR